MPNRRDWTQNDLVGSLGLTRRWPLPVHHGSNMVTSWDESDRRHLADLIREDDRLRAKHAEWNAQRERAAASLVRESEADGLLYRECENSEPAPAPAPDGEPFEA